ncbi:unnamed protein product [Ceutorhynchus assimilis]|uniref:Uncharacterized protein n=1 Tax=Ceutorhynchus assimilis TaxID=467358 RepID=A0A9N9MSM7_9CUCU|nr:unnamed protein product [Ceutorhynchus assimilis]
MFTKITLLSCLVAVLAQEPVPIISSQSVIEPDGSSKWNYESADGSSQQQVGQQLAEGGQAVQGVAQWYDPQGTVHTLQYVADENGYQPNSDDLPVAPEVPASVMRALEWNAAHPEEEN